MSEKNKQAMKIKKVKKDKKIIPCFVYVLVSWSEL